MGRGLRPTLRADDGTIEAMEHESLPIWGVQFHPERMCLAHRQGKLVDGLPILEHFLHSWPVIMTCCKGYHSFFCEIPKVRKHKVSSKGRHMVFPWSLPFFEQQSRLIGLRTTISLRQRRAHGFRRPCALEDMAVCLFSQIGRRFLYLDCSCNIYEQISKRLLSYCTKKTLKSCGNYPIDKRVPVLL